MTKDHIFFVDPDPALSTLLSRVMEVNELISQISRKDLTFLLDELKKRRSPHQSQPARIIPYFKSWILLILIALAIGGATVALLSGRDKPRGCIIPMPVDSKNVFRPPADCSFCQGVLEVDTVRNITSEEFELVYAYSGRPVLIKDALINWTASKVFSYEFFRHLYSASAVSTSRRCQFFPYRTEFHSLRHALSMTPERRAKPFYFGWSNCDSESADVLRQHYGRPYFLPERSESSRTDWIFMGTAGLGAHMHVDHVGLPSWQAQILGKKRWSLEPPPECFYKCQSMEVIVEPGDTIVLDTNIWYHKTSVLSEGISITIGSEYD